MSPTKQNVTDLHPEIPPTADVQVTPPDVQWQAFTQCCNFMKSSIQSRVMDHSPAAEQNDCDSQQSARNVLLQMATRPLLGTAA